MYMRMIYLILLILSVAGWVLIEYRRKLGPALRAAGAWVLIFVGGIAAYGMWGDISRYISPSQMSINGPEVELIRAQDGHFYIDLLVNETPIRFMVDTGASHMTLSLQDADRLDLALDDLDFLGMANTANGMVRTARVKLDQVRLGEDVARNFTAYVNQGDMDISLLGMTYLSRFSLRIEGNRMVLSR